MNLHISNEMRKENQTDNAYTDGEHGLQHICACLQILPIWTADTPCIQRINTSGKKKKQEN